ncbi:MAG: DNA repair protein RecO [Chloroflexi bacterium]|nr:MAG: DNA repair protein RecO [Chloroflexota bacterium]
MPRPARSIRTQAIILKRRDFGEADRVLTLLTPQHGKVEGIAKGARKPTSTKTGHVELFTLVDILLHRGRNLDIVVQAELVEPYLALREDLQRGAYASYAVELLDRFTEAEDEDSGELFGLLKETFERLCKVEDARLAVRYYEIRLLDIVGFRPELQECVVTREPLRPIDQYFSYSGGGVVSPEGLHLVESAVKLPLRTLKLLRHLQRSPYNIIENLKVDQNTHQDIERILLGYITFILERNLQSVDFIRRIRS